MKDRISGLIIGAGLSSRMGQPKPLISFKGIPFLAHIILKMNPICRDIIIVTGHEGDKVKSEIKDWFRESPLKIQSKIHWCYNPLYEKGMLSSLQAGIKKLTGCDWFLYHFADQPDIPKNFYSAFAKQIDNTYNWIQPRFKTKAGHPIFLSTRLIPDLLQLNLNDSLRHFAEKKDIKRKLWDTSVREILLDYDTPRQLQTLIGTP